ncbi:diadenylate cyclase CdaA [Streptococcus sp.]|uniref:diadenylate cyclase CdaA n=1 Tax=Streptococcus sp. TaxID=1306 RepID=UPI00391E02D1
MLSLNQLLDPQYWDSLLASPWTAIVHLIDIALVIYIIYHLSKSLAGTKIMTLIKGVFLFVLAQIVAGLVGLQTISWLMNLVMSYAVIAAVVIFAPEFRAMLEKLGRTTHIFSGPAMTSEEMVLESIVKAVKYMSPRKIGALVAIEGARTLQEYRSTGIELDATVSGELLINIFIPNTPLHDGAVIIKDIKVAVASAYFPLSESAGISKEFGTRHRAAIGLSEVSDAFVFVVSEETGGLSIAVNGNFRHDLTMEEFEASLRSHLISESETPTSWWKRLGGQD